MDAEGNVFTVLFGPRISWRDHDRFTPFLQVLGGMARADEVTLTACNVPILACIPLPTETAFAMTAGGGLDYKLNHRFALRLLQAEYLLTLKAGRYSVSGHVDDSRGGAADCQVGVEAQEQPPPPEMVELERRLDLHSIYFRTARPTTANPNGGLVPSQENILAILASDFKKYLKYRPDAHLILGGHADERGSEEYNKRLTGRRVERTRSYLIGHGVLATAIETRSFGKEDQLNAEQIKEQIAANPDLTPDDRRQMLVNLNVMVLANNRRVDVALSTTGQQSTRRYPFNARDYLALISTKGGEKEPRVTKRKPKR